METNFTAKTKDMSVVQERFDVSLKRDITLPKVINVYEDWAANYDQVYG